MKRRIFRFEPSFLSFAVRADVRVIIYVPFPEPVARRAVLRPLVAGPAVGPHEELYCIFVLRLAEDHLSHNIDDGHACVDINQ